MRTDVQSDLLNTDENRINQQSWLVYLTRVAKIKRRIKRSCIDTLAKQARVYIVGYNKYIDQRTDLNSCKTFHDKTVENVNKRSMSQAGILLVISHDKTDEKVCKQTK